MNLFENKTKQEGNPAIEFIPNGYNLPTELTGGLFSFFRKPVRNIYPCQNMNPMQAYQAITSTRYERVTRVLRSIGNKESARNYKASEFDYCCFSGTFTTRGDKNLIQHSGFITLDFDHIENIRELQDQLILNNHFETILSFVSPSGDGLKWIVKIDLRDHSHLEWFQCISYYVKSQFDLNVDKSGKDISRCCFLPFDPQAYINPKYLL